LLNVLSNAVKFTPPGGTVIVRREVTGAGDLALVVADTGIGVDTHALPRLFEPFFQADASTERKFGGAGLGLAISHKLMALHNGSLLVESAGQRGTTVSIIFPGARIVRGNPITAPSI
jgi:signal transduction histidine kinase